MLRGCQRLTSFDYEVARTFQELFFKLRKDLKSYAYRRSMISLFRNKSNGVVAAANGRPTSGEFHRDPENEREGLKEGEHEASDQAVVKTEIRRNVIVQENAAFFADDDYPFWS